MNNEHDLIYSPLQQHYTVGTRTVEICIYRMPDTAWSLEVVDEYGNSTVWDDQFETDQAALDEVMNTIREEGIEALVGEPAHPMASDAQGNPLGFASPWPDDELAELEAFLHSDAVSDETMLLDHLDGYLTAIIIGPTTLSLNEWYPGIWGSRKEDAPHFENMDQAQRIIQLIMRHYNGIIGSIEQDADKHAPFFSLIATADDSTKLIDAEMWAVGFMDGIALCRVDWQLLFDAPRGQAWLKPIRLLGADHIGETDMAQAETHEQRDELARQIPASIAAIYRYWLPFRQEVQALLRARTIARAHPKKVGRNDPCPCGSGEKFKKCCGAASTLH